MPYGVRLMRQEDILQVIEIDREAFPTQWPPNNYKRELQNRLAYFMVAYDDGKTVIEPEAETPPETGGLGLFSRIKRLFRGESPATVRMPAPIRQYLAGFAGIWLLAGEAHITNVAVRKCCQRRGIGELLLISIIELATRLKADIITLEVRAFNTPAQNLYLKYGFSKAGVRPTYYTDNREDALLMSTGNIASASFQARLQQLKRTHSAKYGTANRLLNIAEERYTTVK